MSVILNLINKVKSNKTYTYGAILSLVLIIVVVVSSFFYFRTYKFHEDEYIIDKGEAIIVNLNYFTGGRLRIPSRIDGYPVGAIDDGAFENYTTITSVYIPKSVKRIGSNAFSGCKDLESISFHWRSELTYIGPGAFSETGVKRLRLPKEVSRFHYSQMLKLERISVHRSNEHFTSLNGILYNEDGTVLLMFPPNHNAKELTISNTVESIHNNAFSQSQRLESITFESNSQLESIENTAFFNSKSLLEIYLPDSLIRIGNQAFYDATNLTTVDLGENSSLNRIGQEAFRGTTSLELFNIPSLITRIESGVFRDSGLVTMSIPINVTRIGERAFQGATALEYIYIPTSVTTIMSDAFLSCSELSIYTGFTSRPTGWVNSSWSHGLWNPNSRPVFWGTSEN